MKRFALFFAVVFVLGFVSLGHFSTKFDGKNGNVRAQEVPPKQKDGDIRWPNSIIVPTPVPIPPPQIITKLTADQLFVVTWDKDFFLLDSPRGLVKTTKESGPIRIRGSFADGNGKVETRTYKDKFIYIVEAAGVGTVELLAIPSGVTDEANIVRKTLDVDSGVGPRPPPGPNPPSPAPIPLDGFRVLIVYDDSVLTGDQRDGIITGKTVRDYLQSHCVVGADGKTKDFWIIQTGSDVTNAPKWIGDAIQRRPDRKTFMLISNGKTGYDGEIPANKDAAMTELKKVGG